MWVATVILNQHYIIDLIAGALLSVIAWWIAKSSRFERIFKMESEIDEPQVRLR
jgi:membrane-associated phospholipid phosphatase